MPPGRRPSLTHDEFVTTGIEYADEHGLDALTLRELGRVMDISATAVYRYFPNKEALYSAMRDTLLGRVVMRVDLEGDPRSVLGELSRAFRAQSRAHPCLGQLMVLSRLDGPTADAVPLLVGGALRRLGVPDEHLAVAYRQLESFVVGTTLFDFAGAPGHLTERRRRLASATELGFESALIDEIAVDALNERAFAATLEVLLDAIDALTQPTE